MNRLIHPRRWLAPLLTAAALAGPLSAAAGLLDSSPFLPPNAPAGAAAKDAAPLELRSILKTGDEYEFSLYDTARKQSTWTKLNETGHDFVVKAFDPDRETVTVEQQNRTYKLALKEVRIVPLNMVPTANQGPVQTIASFPQPNPPGGTRGQPGTATAAAGPGAGPPGAPSTLTPEQIRNLEADINRRRELRRQAAASSAQQGSQPAAQR
ncbi:MAG TPA: hypothetical protein VMF63_05080 [Opitutaceae bacterium]|nr:hypothetical protein [Opitutaceae bacterium]